MSGEERSMGNGRREEEGAFYCSLSPRTETAKRVSGAVGQGIAFHHLSEAAKDR